MHHGHPDDILPLRVVGVLQQDVQMPLLHRVTGPTVLERPAEEVHDPRGGLAQQATSQQQLHHWQTPPHDHLGADGQLVHPGDQFGLCPALLHECAGDEGGTPGGGRRPRSGAVRGPVTGGRAVRPGRRPSPGRPGSAACGERRGPRRVHRFRREQPAHQRADRGGRESAAQYRRLRPPPPWSQDRQKSTEGA